MVSEMNNNPHFITPEEAKEKICPMIWHESCVAEDCMAWRWGKIYVENNKLFPGQADTTYSTTHGRCGKVLI
tara:strand:+ start:2244 stop:2459 length:216 start_codon:yes stop_codon:yes gene_type:complete